MLDKTGKKLRLSVCGALADRREKEGGLTTCFWNLNICIEKVDAKCWLEEMTLVMTSFPWHVFVSVCLASHWLAEIWQLVRKGATGELEVEFKLQRRRCKLTPSFSHPSATAPWRARPHANTSWEWLVIASIVFITNYYIMGERAGWGGGAIRKKLKRGWSNLWHLVASTQHLD